MSKAVPWSGEVRTNGRPSVTFTPSSKAMRLDRDQRLVVVHARAPRRSAAARRAWNMVSAGSGPRASMPSARRVGDRRGDDRPVLGPIAPSSPACGLRPATASRGRGDAEPLAQVARHDPAGLDDQLGRQRSGHRGKRDVDGHRDHGERLAPQHHHRMRRRRARLAASAARYSVWPGMAKPACVEHVLGDRVGDERGRARPRGRADRRLDRFEGRRGARRVGLARADATAERGAARQGSGREHRGPLRRSRPPRSGRSNRALARCRSGSAGSVRTAKGGRPASWRSARPERDLRPDPRRIALGEGEGAAPGPLLVDAPCCVSSPLETLVEG